MNGQLWRKIIEEDRQWERPSEWLSRQIKIFIRDVALPFIEANPGPVKLRGISVKLKDRNIFTGEEKPNAPSYHFKTKLTPGEYELIQERVREDGLDMTKWLNREVTTVCYEIYQMSPLQNLMTGPMDRTITIQQVGYRDSTNIRILERFADLNSMSMRDVIRFQIIFKKMSQYRLKHNIPSIARLL